MDRREILKNALAAPLLGLFGMKQGVGRVARLRPMRAALGPIQQGSMATLVDGDVGRHALGDLANKFSD